MPSPLDHLIVVELSTDVAAAKCAHEFAAWGADVTTVEPPDGSPLRKRSPLVADAEGHSRSLVWEYLGAGKHSLVAEYTRDSLSTAVRALLANADVMVTDWKPRALTEAGLDLEELQRDFPALVIVSSTPFGLSGPYAGFEGGDLQVQALSGFMSECGLPNREPLRAPGNVFAYACGMSAFIGALAAIWERARSGRGQIVEAAQVETVAMFINHLRTEYSGVPLKRHGGPGAGGWKLVPAGDGRCLAMTLKHGRVALSALGYDDSTLPEELRSGATPTMDAMRAYLKEALAQHSAHDVWAATCTMAEPVGLLQTPSDLLTDPHLADRDYFRRVETPGLGPVVHPGPAGRFSASPMPPTTAAPCLGDRKADALSQRADHARVEPAPAPGERSAPLAGLRIIDLTQAWIGPYATLLLGVLGADVVKVEAQSRPDVWRGWHGGYRQDPIIGGNPDAHPGNVNDNFNSVNMNKRDLTLDLRREEGHELLLRLVGGADLVMENYSPRVMGNLGLSYETLREVKPDIVMVSSSGFGATGPYRSFKSNGAATEANAGWDSLFGYPGETPLQMGGMPADAICGLYMAAHALLGLIYRERTGEGQAVEGSMFESGVRYIGEEIAAAPLTGVAAELRGNRDRDFAPQGVFPCRGDDQWLAIRARDDSEFARLCAVATDAQGLLDPRFATGPKRLANVVDLERIISEWTRTLERREAMHLLQKGGVPAAMVLTTVDTLQDPHLAAREWFKPLHHPDVGVRKHQSAPWRFSRSTTTFRSASPRLGEHSEEILRDELGLSAAEVAALVEQGVTTRVVASKADGAQYVEGQNEQP